MSKIKQHLIESERLLKEVKEKFEEHLDQRYGDDMGKFHYSSKTRHVADVFYEFSSKFLKDQQTTLLKIVREEVEKLKMIQVYQNEKSVDESLNYATVLTYNTAVKDILDLLSNLE